MARKRRFISGAIEREGALTRKAKRAGMSVLQYARRHEHDTGPRGSTALRTGQQARFYLYVLRPASEARRNPSQRFLVNHPGSTRDSKGGHMAKRRTPPRYKSGPKKGQFMSKRARAAHRRNPTRKAAAKSNPRKRRRSTARRRSSPRRRRSYRRNPVRGISVKRAVKTLMSGTVAAGQMLVGKAAVRSVPDLLGLPKEGNIGLAVQAATALVVGFVADMMLGKDAGTAITAGGLSAPLETLIVAYKVPWLSDALSPTTAQAGVGAYVSPLALAPGRPALVNPGRTVAPIRRGLGRYATGTAMAHA